jgi:hypothetical protein
MFEQIKIFSLPGAPGHHSVRRSYGAPGLIRRDLDGVHCSGSQTLPQGLARFILLLDVRGASRMSAEYPQGDEPLIPMPALSLLVLRQTVATVAPSRPPEFFLEI